jgi:hypothetical protein
MFTSPAIKLCHMINVASKRVLADSYYTPTCKFSYQIATLPHRAIQSVLTNSRRIEPARLELAGRSPMVVVKAHDRLADSIVAFPASENLGTVGTQTATWVVATTAGT